MRNLFHLFLMLLGVSLMNNSYSQSEKKDIRTGNELYSEGKYEDAEASYRQALDENSNSFEGSFNLGDAAYKQDKFEEAANQFDLLSKQLEDKDKISKSYHNLGNSYLKSKEYEKSVDAFKNALRNNPSDIDTKYNLAYAQQKLKEQQKQEQDSDENKENDEKKDDEKKDENKEEEKKDENKDDEKKDQNQEKNEDQKQEENKESQPKNKPGKMSKEDAQRILDALKNEEKNVQEKLKKKKLKATKVNIEKDW